MKIRLSQAGIDGAEVRLIERVSGEDMKRCYQCGNCSGGCPVAYAMEVPPSQIMRFLQLGMTADVMNANSMWVCVGCLQCSSRCPQGVSVAGVLEGLRQITLRKGVDRTNVADIPVRFLEKAPQQAIVCGFRKFVS
mgnify:FL=1